MVGTAWSASDRLLADRPTFATRGEAEGEARREADLFLAARLACVAACGNCGRWFVGRQRGQRNCSDVCRRRSEHGHHVDRAVKAGAVLPPEGWLLARTAAGRLGVDVSRVYQLIREGELAARRENGVYWVDAAAVDERLQTRAGAGR